jgi:hypothetical protein
MASNIAKAATVAAEEAVACIRHLRTLFSPAERRRCVLVAFSGESQSYDDGARRVIAMASSNRPLTTYFRWS